MSEKKLRDFLQEPRTPTAGRQQLTPVVLSDSKGGYLRDQISHPEDREIVWWNKSGAKITDSRHWLERNIKHKIIELGNIHLYVWLGTCDLTSKNKDKTIALTSQHPEAAQNIFEELAKFKAVIQQFPGSRITFVEIPYYSILRWNLHAKKGQPEDRIAQDQQLSQQITEVNSKITELNTALGVRTPLLNLHLKARKHVKRGKDKPYKHYINYQLYLDGIHPKPILAKVWLAEFSKQIRADCCR